MFKHLKGSETEVSKKSDPIPELPGFTIVLPKKHEEDQFIPKNKKRNRKNKKKERNEIRVCNDGTEVLSDDEECVDDSEIYSMSEEMQIELALKQSLQHLKNNSKENINNDNNIEDEIVSNENDNIESKILQKSVEFIDPPPKSKCDIKCLGIVHDLYINCINCGFIMCKKDEKQKYCPSCGISMNREEIVKKVNNLFLFL